VVILLLAGCLIVPDDECVRADRRGEREPAHCDWWGWDSGWSAPDTGDTWSGGDFTPGQICLSWQLDLVEGGLSEHNGGSQSYLRVTLAPEGWVSPGAPDLEATCTIVGTINGLTALNDRDGWVLRFPQAPPQSYGICETMSSNPFSILDGKWRVWIEAPDEALVLTTAESDGELTGLFSGLSAPPGEELAAMETGHIRDINLSGDPVALPEDGSLPTGRYITTSRSCRPWQDN
jgi:hypothetical protein